MRIMTTFCIKYLPLFFTLYSSWAQALIQCEQTTPEKNEVLNIIGNNITVGPDMPLGTVLYGGTISFPTEVHLRCSSPKPDTGTLKWMLGIDSVNSPLSNWAGPPLGGKVYETNIPGVGIAIWYSGKAVTKESPVMASEIQVAIDVAAINYGMGGVFDFSLIKIGETPPGNYTIDSSLFPNMIRYYDPGTNVAGNFPIIARRYQLSGSVNVVAKTCTTPDVNVPLGTHNASVFSSAAGTPWVDASIKLTDCPTFSGYHSAYSRVNLATGDIPPTTNNQISVSLSPVNGIFDAENGIMNIISSPESARGVSIQIAHGTPDTATPQPFNFNSPSVVDLPKSGDSTIIYPLVARYVKTSSAFTAGVADGRVTFTVNYY
ncbi:fimbrial protein [Klebsiella sp. I138]|uniref:fimbrial protein n=1 Tax=Klebsiella sp. I138 TaxID=2755385 RepID=UPI003DA9070D